MSDRQTALAAAAQPALAWIANQQAVSADSVERLCNINSGSFNADGVNAVIDALLPMLAPLGGNVQRLDVPPLKQLGDDGQWFERPMGQALQVRKRPEAPLQVLLGGHLDTVFPKDSAFQTVQRPDADTLHGPGVADLKGGLVVMINALRALEQNPQAGAIGWTILLNPDEEIGSRSSMPLLEAAAKQADLGLIYEPAYPDGGLAGARKGSGNFEVLVRGKAAHAGREHHLGRNAIAAVARVTAAIDDLNGQRDGVTLNVGKLSGGGPANVVPELGILRLNVRLQQQDDQAWVRERLESIVSQANAADGISATLHGGFTRPPKPIDAGIQRLIDHLHASAELVGTTLSFTPTGGCCDGNNLACPTSTISA